MQLVGTLHDNLVVDRRIQVLASHLTRLIPDGSHVLDVGCGDGSLDCVIASRLARVSIEGIDVLVRPDSRIPVRIFNGRDIPYADASFDAVIFVDVLHHAEDPKAVLREAIRVGKTILIKDHFKDGFLAGPTLRFMDWVGNARHGVALPYNYWTTEEWKRTVSQLGLSVDEMNLSLGLYPQIVAWIFERRLHFIARLVSAQSGQTSR